MRSKGPPHSPSHTLRSNARARGATRRAPALTTTRAVTFEGALFGRTYSCAHVRIILPQQPHDAAIHQRACNFFTLSFLLSCSVQMFMVNAASSDSILGRWISRSLSLAAIYCGGRAGVQGGARAAGKKAARSKELSPKGGPLWRGRSVL